MEDNTSPQKPPRVARFLSSTKFNPLVFVLLFAVLGGGILLYASRAATATANCGTDTSAPNISHVVVIMMENHAYNEVIGSSQAPYINSVANACGLATNMHAVQHPSLPNYIAITSGSTQGAESDANGGDPLPSQASFNVPSIFTQVGTNWKSLMEGMSSNCQKTDSGEYVAHHNPAAYYTNIASQCATNDIPLGSTPDISAAYTFITPNLIDDMHDGTVQDGDNFLKSFLPELFATPQYQNNQTVIFVTWDEDDTDSLAPNQIPTLVISPYTKAGTKDNTNYTHYSVLRTSEEILCAAGQIPSIASNNCTNNPSLYLGGAASAASMAAGFNLLGAGTTAPPAPTPPSVPSGLKATVVSSTEIDLNWTASTGTVKNYIVLRNGTAISGATPTGTSYNDTGLTPSTAYSYSVEAVDSSGSATAASSAVSATTQAASTTPPTTTADPSGVPVPIGDIPANTATGEPAWHQIFVDDFTKAAPLGTFNPSDGNSSTVVYTGDHGGQWVSYPDGYQSTNSANAPSSCKNGQEPGYAPSQVLSVQGGVLNFYLHNATVVGVDNCGASYTGPMGANLSPVLPGGTRYQTYGRYTARFKLDTHSMNDFHAAWLLWPDDSTGPDVSQCAESDYPEADLSDTVVTAFAHYGCSGAQDSFESNIDFTQWHTFTQEWMPGIRKYYLDGNLIGTSTSQVYSGPERWQLQTEPSGSNDGDSGNLLVDWVSVYSYGAPASTAAPTVSLASPSNGATVGGQVTVSANATNATTVQFYVDGKLTANSTSSPYSFTWNTTSLSGSHSLYAIATNASGQTTQSSTINVTVSNPDTTTPTVPTGVQAAYNSTTQVVNVTWTPSTDAGGVVSGYYVYRSTNGGAYGLISTSSIPAASYTDSTTSPGTKYTYEVQAYDGVSGNKTANSAPSAAVTTPALADTTVPTVSITSPTDGATVSGSVTIKANATDNVKVASVAFYAAGQLLNTATTSPYVSSAWDTTQFANGSSQKIDAIATDSSGNQSQAEITVTVSNGATPEPLAAPTGVAVAVNSTTDAVTVTWKAVTGATGYLVLRANGTTGQPTTLAPVTGLSYVDSTAQPNSTYTYTIEAFSGTSSNPANVSAPSTGSIANIPSAPTKTTVSPPSALMAVATSSTQINLSWQASTTANATYDVYRNGATKIASGITGTSFGDSNLNSGTTYSYYIVAEVGGTLSAPTKTVSATTLSTTQTGYLTGILMGVVTSQKTGKPIRGATVRYLRHHHRVFARTNKNGTYALDKAPTGTHTFVYDADDYHSTSSSITIVGGQTTANNVTLTPKSGRR